jgi:serine/threonine-protein kinase
MTPTPPPEAPFAAPDDVTTTQVGRYELLLKLAVGGMGSVYVGRQRGAAGFERLVAVKQMHSHIAQTPEMLGAFLDEARIASLVHHPNVVRVQDVYEAEGECLLVMDYVDGVALSGLLWSMRRRSERLPPRVSLRVMIDALLGLHAAHELRNLGGTPMHVVHRDVSPHNVLLGADDGIARVTDFGVARAAERSTQTRTGQIKGKLRYMAPEQASEGEVDRRADVFSAGVVLWELLAGRRFFQGENDAKLLLAITGANYPDLATIRPDLPAPLAALVTRALSRNPDERWPSALAFAQALEAWGRASDGLAHHAEVAALVSDACSDQLQAQREAVSAALGRPSAPSLSELSAPPVWPPRPSGPSPFSTQAAFIRAYFPQGAATAAPSLPPTTNEHLSVAATRLGPLEAPPGPRFARWSPLSVLGVIAVSAALGMALMITRHRTAPTADHAAAPPVPSAAATPPAAASVRIFVVSEAGVSAVEAPSAAEVRVSVAGATLLLPKSNEPVRLGITLADGERVAETIYPDENAVVHVRAVREPPPPTPPPSGGPRAHLRPSKHGLRPNAPPSATASTGLKKNPYE